MSYYHSKQRVDGCWETVFENDGESWPVGYCAAYRSWVRAGSCAEFDDASYHKFAAKHHTNGHKTSRDADLCYEQYVVEHELLRLRRPRRLHADTLLQLVQTMLPSGPMRGVEVGVRQGQTSAYLLEMLPNLHLTLVDCWPHGAPAQQAHLALTLSRVQFAEDRVRLMVRLSVEAAAALAGEQYDWVFIDANHGYESVCEDIAAWWPLVRPGGILCGHDYQPAVGTRRYGKKDSFPGVRKAVNQFVEQEHVLLCCSPGMVWWVHKP